MKANELRIGNWISTSFLDEERLMIISEIGEFSAVCENKETDAECGFKAIYPIPLTNEWLVKFGFDKSTENVFKILHTDNNFGFSVKLYSSDVFKEKIKSVHQLQNLYFALTGEELKIN